MRRIFVCLTFLILLLVPLQANASAPLPFMPSKEENREIKPVSSESLFSGITSTFKELITPVYSWGVTLITALFIVGTVVMIMSLLFKNAQWQKFGQGTMLYSFIVMLVLRGLPILILSIRSANDVDLLLNQVISILSYSTVFIGLVGIAASFLFRFGFRLIEHPDFHRWSKNLLTVSIMMMIFSFVVPFLFPLI
ncbi:MULTISPECIES: hypothetical protein [Bacillus]|uniref:hypothetical protein n=1 Tax=Bacillus TaxID=1386 RepID=UPI00273E15C1|nr:hypothetical protein [Bacillus sp. MMSF_3328]